MAEGDAKVECLGNQATLKARVDQVRHDLPERSVSVQCKTMSSDAARGVTVLMNVERTEARPVSDKTENQVEYRNGGEKSRGEDEGETNTCPR